MADWQDRASVDTMLDDCDTWAIVGLSGDPQRTAHRIAALLQERGKRIVPIHPSAPIVLGEQGYPTLADVPFPVDVVDVFRRSEAAGEFADQAVEINASGVWFQLGVIDEAAYRRTIATGTLMVMDTCPAIEWRKRARDHRASHRVTRPGHGSAPGGHAGSAAASSRPDRGPTQPPRH